MNNGINDLFNRLKERAERSKCWVTYLLLSKIRKICPISPNFLFFGYIENLPMLE